MYLAHWQLLVEQLRALALEIVPSCRAWKMTAVLVGVVQKELHRGLAVVEHAVFVAKQEVHLAERAILLIANLHTSTDEVDLAYVNQPVQQQMLEVPADSILLALSEEVDKVVDIDRGSIEADLSDSQRISD